MRRIGNILMVVIVFMAFTTNVMATTGEINALQSAKVYLEVYPFSYIGLVEQLKYDGYLESEATYAADHCNADWYEQADRAAANYLSIMAFSRSGLIEQLEYDGFTHEQAEYGANQNGYAANSSSSIKSNNTEEVQNDSLQVQLDEAIGDKIDFTIYGDILPSGFQYTVIIENQSEYNLEGLFCDITLLDENGNSTLEHLEYSDTLFSGNNATISFTSEVRMGDYYIDWGFSNAINASEYVKEDETKELTTIKENYTGEAISGNDSEPISFVPTVTNLLELQAKDIIASENVAALTVVCLALDIKSGDSGFSPDLGQNSYIGKDGLNIYVFFHGKTNDMLISYRPITSSAYYAIMDTTSDIVMETAFEQICLDGFYKNDKELLYGILQALQSGQ